MALSVDGIELIVEVNINILESDLFELSVSLFPSPLLRFGWIGDFLVSLFYT